jgi:hypothetical protein
LVPWFPHKLIRVRICATLQICTNGLKNKRKNECVNGPLGEYFYFRHFLHSHEVNRAGHCHGIPVWREDGNVGCSVVVRDVKVGPVVTRVVHSETVVDREKGVVGHLVASQAAHELKGKCI